jgi:hypothetical protein
VELRVCHSEGAFGSALGFRTLTIVSTEPNAADRFRAIIHRESEVPSPAPPVPEPSPTPDTSSGAQKPDAMWDDKAIEDVLMKLRSAPKPIFEVPTNQAPLTELPLPAPPVSPLDFAAPPPTIRHRRGGGRCHGR